MRGHLKTGTGRLPGQGSRRSSSPTFPIGPTSGLGRCRGFVSNGRQRSVPVLRHLEPTCRQKTERLGWARSVHSPSEIESQPGAASTDPRLVSKDDSQSRVLFHDLAQRRPESSTHGSSASVQREHWNAIQPWEWHGRRPHCWPTGCAKRKVSETRRLIGPQCTERTLPKAAVVLAERLTPGSFDNALSNRSNILRPAE